MRTDELDYDLPEELIAHRPADRRDAARLMLIQLDADREHVTHHTVADLPALLQPGDLLILNDTRVLPARFQAVRRRTGGRVSGLFLRATDEATWHVLLESGGKLTADEWLDLLAHSDGSPTDQALQLHERQSDGSWLATRHGELPTAALLERIGVMPLPPYIERRRTALGAHTAALDPLDRQRYQTVYAASNGAVAAPTAGLHFTEALLSALTRTGVHIAHLTLHIGLATFQPIRAESLDDHPMHSESFSIPASTLTALRSARADHRRIIPVGTTSVRALESLPDPLPELDSGECYTADTQLFIKPPFAFRFTDGLMTNFHLPRSTLLALVAARLHHSHDSPTGLDRLKHFYQIAIAHHYRFYSYGDTMLILPSRQT